MQLLLVAKQQIAAREAASAVGAFKRLLFRVGTLMALQVLQSRKGATASSANMGPRLVGLGRWDVPIRGLAIGLDLLLVFLRRGYRWRFRIQGPASIPIGSVVLTRHISGDFVDAGEINHFGATVTTLSNHRI